ncbi:MAG: TonB-dependent receptor [Gammaproteobacteria bacterium]
MKSDLISKAVRYALVAGAATALAAPAVFAQDAAQSSTNQNQNQNQNANTAQLGKIEVTGTRIKRTSVETAQPVTVITQAQIKASGLTSIGEMLQQISSTGSSINTQFNNGGNGADFISLRNLGSQRVLVLVDGHRVTPQPGGSADLNNVPISIIDHIEILQDGASAIYGSDAISGVINIITIKNYNGAEANAYYGMFDGKNDGGGWDGKTQEYDFTIGSSGDRSGVVMNVSYVNASPMYAGNRSISKEPLIGSGAPSGSSYTAGGRFLLLTPGNNSKAGCSYSATGGFSECDLNGGVGAPNLNPTLNTLSAFTDADRFNYAPLNYLVTPNERTALYVQGHYDLADNLTFNTSAIFNDRVSSQQLAPNVIGIGPGGPDTANGSPIGISGQNPYNPFHKNLVAASGTGATAQPCFNAGTCDELVFGLRRGLEMGNRVFNQNQTYFSYNGGFTGYFNMLGSEWDWDLGYNYGNMYFSDLTQGLVNTANLALALGPAYLPAGEANIPSNYQCGSAASPVPGCVPVNYFGGFNLTTGQGSITPGMVQYLTYEAHDAVSVTTRDYTANITGDLFNLPAGPVGLAVGAESLEGDGFNHPDALTQEGNTTGNVAESTNGREDTKAEYVEFNIPLVTDAPFMKDVSLDLANRWSQFKWEGGNPGAAASGVEHGADNSSGRAALRWQATDELLLRGSWSQGFRIPSISEFFTGNSQAYPTISDPCVGPAGAKPGTVGCPTGHIIQPNAQIQTTVGGNPNMTPERSISRTVGFVYSPDWFPGFDFSADYYKVELLDPVAAIPAQTILNGCYSGNLTYCSLITRGVGGAYNANGVITNVKDVNTNIGSINTEGVDVITDYKFPSTSIGDFKASLSVTFTKSYVLTQPFGSGALSSQELAGTTTFDGTVPSAGGGATGGIPKQRANFGLNWNYGDWSAAWNVEYISPLIEDCNGALTPLWAPSRCPITGSYPFTTGPQPLNHIGATTYHDVAVTYHVDSWNTDFTFGIRNLFDKEPPIAMSSLANSFLPDYYRAPGRFFYGRVSVKF